MPRGRRGPSYPQVQWTANDRKLSWELITILEGNAFLNRAIWPGDTTVGTPKVEACKELAVKLLRKESDYREHLRTKEGKKFYAKSIKGHLERLQDKCRKGKERLGVTGAGLLNENEIGPDSPLYDKWMEVKGTCPYFYQLRDLLGDCVSDHSITEDLPDIDDVMTREPPTLTETDEMREDEGIDKEV